MAAKTSHTLFEPIVVDGVEKSTIELRRLKAKDIRAMEAMDGKNADKMLFMIQKLSGWPPEAVEELDASDLDALGKIIEGFTGRKR